MKKRVVTMTFAWMLAALLAAGCGNTEAPAEEAEAEIEEAAEPVEEAEEEAVEEEPAEIPPVPETDEWATDLYNALLADDYETVLELAPDPATVHEHCDPYEDTDWSLWDYETGFRMVMSDGQVMGVVLYENDDDSWEIDSFVSYQEGDGFDYTGYGDHQVTLYSDGGYSYLKNGNELVSNAEGQGSFTMESEEDVYTVWHM